MAVIYTRVNPKPIPPSPGWIFTSLPAGPGGEGQIFTETVTERQDVSDAISKLLLKNFPDDILASDSVSQAALRNIAENQIVSDSVMKLLSFSASDTILITDTLQRFFFMNPSENQTISDVLSKLLTKSITESQAVSDSTALIRLMILRDPEAVLLADSVRKSLSLSLAAENQAVADAAQKTLNKFLADSLAITDTLISAIFLKQISESQTVIDGLIKSLFLQQSENQTVSDAVAKTVWKYLLEDQHPITDSGTGTIFRILAAFVENVLTEVTDMALHSAGVVDPGRRISEIIDTAAREAKTKGMRR